MMRDFGDESAGSTPLPPFLDSFSPSLFLVEDEPQSLPTGTTDLTDAELAADQELWTHLALDGWCFNSDNHHYHQHESPLRPAASEPLRPKTACGSRRPPRPSLGSSYVRETGCKRKHPVPDRFNHRGQEWDDSVGNLNSAVVGSLASENDKDEMTSSDSDESEVQSDLPANEKRPPEIGMEFSSEDEAYKFYKKYADEFGFSVRKGKVQRLSSGAIRKRNFLCSRQGYRSRKAADTNPAATKYQRKETRTGCNASIQLTVEHGKWVISSFVSDHNHELEDKPKKDSIPVLIDDRADISSGDFLRPENVQSLMDCFVSLQAKDPSFFYAIQLDSSNRAANFFWRDCGSRMDYGYFSDVVVFDTTCRANGAVVASFWGLNHHRRRVTFGWAILLDECVESFVWLFGVFTAAMENVQPGTLYSTDESREIATAAALKLPKAKHRLCASNIWKNAERRLSRYFEQSGFEEAFKKCLFGCESREEFESNWDLFLVRFDLVEDSWLVDVRKLWENWSHLFRRETFSGGVEVFFETPDLDPTFRNLACEIMSLPDLVQKYDRQVQIMRLEELTEDIQCDEVASVRSRKGMEKQAEDLYTRAVFEKFQDELLDSLSLAIEEDTKSSADTISTFKLTEEGHEDIVRFDSSNSSVTCSCGKFDSEGILCGHCIKVLNAKNIFQIPLRYVLKRWTKSAKEEVSGEKNRKPPSSYTTSIMHKALKIAAKSRGIEESRNMVEGYLDLVLKKAEEILKEKGPDLIDSKSGELEPEDTTSCAIRNGARHLRNKKMITSTSSGVNQEQGSKNTMKSNRRTKDSQKQH